MAFFLEHYQMVLEMILSEKLTNNSITYGAAYLHGIFHTLQYYDAITEKQTDQINSMIDKIINL